MIDDSYIGQPVENKQGEQGEILSIGPANTIRVRFKERIATYTQDSFDLGGLRLLNPETVQKGKQEKCQEEINAINARLKDPLHELSALTGLAGVKTQIEDIVCQVKNARIRKMMGLKVPTTTRHLLFLGNPGTGKTTVARIVARLYNALGILSKGHLVEADRSQLVAAYTGQTAIKTRKVLEKALGGVLFIDEAYSLYHGDRDEYGVEAIDTITKFMEDHRDDLVVICAGYEERMKGFLEANPGLASRFKTNIHFEDYDWENLYTIFEGFFLENDYCLSEDAKAYAQTYFRKTGNHHANARDARNLFEDSVYRQARRLNDLTNLDVERLTTIEKNDLAFAV